MGAGRGDSKGGGQSLALTVVMFGLGQEMEGFIYVKTVRRLAGPHDDVAEWSKALD